MPAPSTAAVRRPTRPPALVWALTGLHIAVMAMLTFLYPPFTGYDESWHVDMTVSYYDGHGFYGPGERQRDRGVEVATNLVPVPPPKPPYSQAPVPPRGQRGSFDALDDGRPAQYPAPNQMVQHPPLYYVTGALLLHAVPGGADLPYDQQVWILRGLSILLMAPLPLIAWATARRLVGDGLLPVAAAAVVLAVPNLQRVGAAVNNDNLLTPLAAGLMLVLAGVIAGDLRARTGVSAGLLLGLAVLTKGTALGLTVVLVAAYLVAWRRHRRSVLVPLGWATVVTAGLGGWWWVRNLVDYGTVQPTGLGRAWEVRIYGPLHPGTSEWTFGTTFLRGYGTRIWSAIGLPDVPSLPVVTSRLWLAALLVGVAVGIARGFPGRQGRAAAVTMTLPALAVTAIVAAGSLGSYHDFGRVYAAQGRYVYCALTALAAVAVIGWGLLDPSRGRILLPLLVLAAFATQAACWLLVLSRWWAPTTGSRPDRLRTALGGVLRWSPWPPPVTIAVFAVTAATAVAVLALTVKAVLGPAGAPHGLEGGWPGPALEEAVPDDASEPTGAEPVAGHPEPAAQTAHTPKL